MSINNTIQLTLSKIVRSGVSISLVPVYGPSGDTIIEVTLIGERVSSGLKLDKVSYTVMIPTDMLVRDTQFVCWQLESALEYLKEKMHYD